MRSVLANLSLGSGFRSKDGKYEPATGTNHHPRRSGRSVRGKYCFSALSLWARTGNFYQAIALGNELPDSLGLSKQLAESAA